MTKDGKWRWGTMKIEEEDENEDQRKRIRKIRKRIIKGNKTIGKTEHVKCKQLDWLTQV